MIQIQCGDYRKYPELAIFLAWLIIKHSISYKYFLLSTFLCYLFTPENVTYRPLAVTSQLQLLSAMLEGKVKVWNTEMSTNVKRATRKGLLPDYYSILAIIFNIIHVFFSKTFFVLFCFPSNMAAKYAVRHVWRHTKVVYLTIRQRGRVVYELIINEGAARVDYLFRDNEAELSNCFSIHSYPKYKL